MIIHHFFLSNSLGRISSFLLFDGQWMNVTKIFITFFIAIVCRLKRFTLWKISCRKMARVITFSILWLPDIQIHYLLRRHATLWRSTENKDLTRINVREKGSKPQSKVSDIHVLTAFLLVVEPILANISWSWISTSENDTQNGTDSCPFGSGLVYIFLLFNNTAFPN